MNTRLVKLAFTLCSLSLLNFAGSLHAQDPNSGDVPQPPGYANGSVPQPPGYYNGSSGSTETLPLFNIQIENGQLSLASFKDREEVKKIWGKDVPSVSATIDNLTKYLRAVDPNLNIILSPEVGNVTIANLKLNTRNLRSISEAVGVASGGAIRGNGGNSGMFTGGGRGAAGGGERSLAFATSQNSESKSSVEVFNLSGYIQNVYTQSRSKVDENTVREKIDELQQLTMNTLKDLHMSNSSADFPNFRYHPGTKLLIVIGKPEAIEVTRKIINALSGQQTNSVKDLFLDTQPAPDQK